MNDKPIRIDGQLHIKSTEKIKAQAKDDLEIPDPDNSAIGAFLEDLELENGNDETKGVSRKSDSDNQRDC